MSTAQREAVTNYRQRLRERGVMRLEVQASESDAPLIRKLALKLRGDPVRAARIRERLRQMIEETQPGLKEILASAPLEGIELTRRSDLGRDVDL